MKAISNWRNQALCADFRVRAKAFGDSLDEDEPYDDEDALDFIDKVCLECPVMTMCKQWVDDNPQEYGVFGGLTAADRNATEDTQ